MASFCSGNFCFVECRNGDRARLSLVYTDFQCSFLGFIRLDSLVFSVAGHSLYIEQTAYLIYSISTSRLEKNKTTLASASGPRVDYIP